MSAGHKNVISIQKFKCMIRHELHWLSDNEMNKVKNLGEGRYYNHSKLVHQFLYLAHTDLWSENSILVILWEFRL